MWETTTSAASFHARLNVALPRHFRDRSTAKFHKQYKSHKDRGRAGASICHKLRSTVAGFWFRASNVPASPSPTVTIRAAATTPAALLACQTKLRVISRVTISQAATEPEIT